MQDPYRILGISPTASEDEIKKAYRSMAKKYHPDVNNGSPEAEQRMKEVNEAYSTIMKMRREGTGSNSGYGYSQGGTGYGGYGGYGQNQSYGNYGYAASPQLQAARNYIHSGYYQEALNLLEQMTERSAEWYYLCGEANLGLGNRVAALNYARQAVSLNPNNLEYRALLSRLEGSSHFYQTSGAEHGFTVPSFLCGNPCISCCLLNSLCNCLCNGCFCPMGYYRTC